MRDGLHRKTEKQKDRNKKKTERQQKRKIWKIRLRYKEVQLGY